MVQNGPKSKISWGPLWQQTIFPSHKKSLCFSCQKTSAILLNSWPCQREGRPHSLTSSALCPCPIQARLWLWVCLIMLTSNSSHYSLSWCPHLSGWLSHHSYAKSVCRCWWTPTFSLLSETHAILCLSFESSPWKLYFTIAFFILSMVPCMPFVPRSQNQYHSVLHLIYRFPE